MLYLFISQNYIQVEGLILSFGLYKLIIDELL
jgi:hypothetical protein